MEDIDFLLASEFTPPIFREDPETRFLKMRQEISHLIPSLPEDDDMIDADNDNFNNGKESQGQEEPCEPTVVVRSSDTQFNSNHPVTLDDLVAITRKNGKRLEEDFLKLLDEANSYLDHCHQPNDHGFSPFSPESSKPKFHSFLATETVSTNP